MRQNGEAGMRRTIERLRAEFLAIDIGFLRVNPDGTYARHSDGGVPRPMDSKMQDKKRRCVITAWMGSWIVVALGVATITTVRSLGRADQLGALVNGGRPCPLLG